MRRILTVGAAVLLAITLTAAPVAAGTTSYATFRLHEAIVTGRAHSAIDKIVLTFGDQSTKGAYVRSIAAAQLKSSLVELRWLSAHPPKACYRQAWRNVRAAWIEYRDALKLAYRWGGGDPSIFLENEMNRALLNADSGFTIALTTFVSRTCR